jgi:glutathione S-transferase
MALIVYGAGLSPFVRKVRLTLLEKNLEYTLDPVNPFTPPDGFLEMSPLKRIPAFRDTSLPEPNFLSDSSVICDYLESKYPQNPLYPSDPYQRARALWFEEYADSVFASTIGGGLFFERIIKKLLGQKTDENVCVATVNEKLPPMFDYLEKQLGNNEYFAGGKFSIADISVATMLINFVHAGETIDPARWPKLAAFSKRLLDRPSFKKLIEEETPFIQQLRAA